MRTLTIIILSLLLLLFLFLYWPTDVYTGEESLRAKKMALESAIYFYHKEYGAYPTGDISSIKALLTGQNPRGLKFLDQSFIKAEWLGKTEYNNAMSNIESGGKLEKKK